MVTLFPAAAVDSLSLACSAGGGELKALTALVGFGFLVSAICLKLFPCTAHQADAGPKHAFEVLPTDRPSDQTSSST